MFIPAYGIVVGVWVNIWKKKLPPGHKNFIGNPLVRIKSLLEPNAISVSNIVRQWPALPAHLKYTGHCSPDVNLSSTFKL